MNQTTKVAVALIVAAGLSTMVYALPERAMAHPRLHLLSPDSDPDEFPFGPNSPDPSSKSDPPAIGSNSADPPPPGAGPPFGPNCVGCISTQNLANGAVTNPKLAAGSVLSANIGTGVVATPNIADQAITTPKISPGAVTITTKNVTGDAVIIPPGQENSSDVKCPSGSVVTGGGGDGFHIHGIDVFNTAAVPIISKNDGSNGWVVSALNTFTQTIEIQASATCATMHP